MRYYTITKVVACLLIVSATTSCLKDKVPAPKETDTEKIFKFETTELCEVNLDLGLNNYSIVAELYRENPLNEDGEKIAGIQPILRSITDKKGVLSDVIDLDKNIKTVYFYTEYVGVPNLIPIDVTDKGINFSVKSQTSKASTRSLTRGVAPSGVLTLGGWDNTSGIPDYLSSRVNLPDQLYYSILKTLPNYSSNSVSSAFQFLNKGNKTELNITKNTPLNLVFLGESASMKNTVCYYHYPTGQEPKSPEDVKLIVAFPNCSILEYSKGKVINGLSSGDNVQLKYWNSEKGVFENEFPAGTTVALAIMSSSFKDNGNIEKRTVYYAKSEFNTSEAEVNREHVILMRKNQNDGFVFMLEDKPRTGNVIEGKYPGGDFHDAILYIASGVDNAISTEGIPEMEQGVSAPETTSMTYEGTLIFEDLWPGEGDYDMNDIMIEYFSTVYRNNSNRVTKTVDEFTVLNIGGRKVCGFGYQLNTNEGIISSVNVSPISEDIATNAKGLEVGQHYSSPTIMIFGNILNQKVGQKYTATTTFTSPVESKSIMPPYNPFITIGARNEGKELHLTNHKPTSLANLSFFGQGFDVSDAEKGIYYVSKNYSYPFALKLPIRNFPVPTEATRIDVTYPKFSDWVKSLGTTNNDWYVK